MPRLVVEGHGHVDVPVGTSILDACQRAGLPLESECGGFAACNSCRVRVLGGADALSPLDVSEEPFLEDDDQRLGCQARLLGDVVVRFEPGI